MKSARELARYHNLALRVDGLKLKGVLRQIEPGAHDRRHINDRVAMDGFPSDASMTTTHLGMLMAIRGTSTGRMVVPKAWAIQ